jgi:LmbE family N-acetylglucosaminyl deacetylase
MINGGLQMMQTLNEQTFTAVTQRVLAISAHPDDSEFHAGGTIDLLVQQGIEVSLVVCTDGRKGGRDLTGLIQTRRDEQHKAAECLGITAVTMLGLPDGELHPNEELVSQLVEEIRLARPDVILTHHPATYWRNIAGQAQPGHSDHRATGTAVFNAVYPRAASRNFYPGRGGDPWYPREIWLFDSPTPDFVVDITGGMNNKLTALAAHQSQQGDSQQLTKAAISATGYFGEQTRPGEALERLILRQ